VEGENEEWRILLLKFEVPIVHYLETRHFLWDSTYPLQCEIIINFPCVLPICEQRKQELE